MMFRLSLPAFRSRPMSRQFQAAVIVFLLTLSPLFGQPHYSDALLNVGITYSYVTPSDFGGGFSVVDFDGDGWDDISCGSTQGDRLRIFHNNFGQFTDTLLPGIAADTFHSRSVMWVDYDNDGDKDLFVCNEGAFNHLYRNDSTLGFANVTQAAGMMLTTMWSYGAAWADYDRDGWLDVYIVNRNPNATTNSRNQLFHNNGDGTFSEVADQAGVVDSAGLGFSATFLDCNNDLWPDIFIANDKQATHNRLFMNNGDGTFADVTDTNTTGIRMDGMGTACGDFDGNGYLDLYITNTPQSSPTFGGNVMLRNHGNGNWSDVGDSLGTRIYKIGWGCNYYDVENDGDIDLFVASGDMNGGATAKNNLFINQGNGTFVDDTLDQIAHPANLSFGSSIGDWNNDGYYDVCVVNGNGNKCGFWENMNNANNWIKFTLEGIISNKDGVGTWIELYRNGNKQVVYTMCGNSYASQHSTAYIIGLGSGSTVDSVVFRWPSGIVNRLYSPTVNQHIHFPEDTSTVFVSRVEPLEPVLLAWPNPTKGPITLSLHDATLYPGEVLPLDILDGRGRLVRRLVYRPTLGNGEIRLIWDGKNAQGRPVEAGMYIARLRLRGKISYRKIVVQD